MKRILLYFSFMLLTTSGLAQVGINNEDPKAMLDITVNDPTAPETTDGILIPRMDEYPTGLGIDQDGMMIFITGAGTPTKGFYYWDQGGTAWVALAGSGGGTLDQAYDFGGAGAGNSITATDGALTIAGEDGLLITGTINVGNTIDMEVTGAGTRMFFNPRKNAFRVGTVSGNQFDDINLGFSSSAFGVNNIASGVNSFVFGFQNVASSNGATAFGFDTNASGIYSTSFGSETDATGSHSTAFGFRNTASGDRSTAFGIDAIASGDNATSFGSFTRANGNHSVAFGNATIASGSLSTAFGQGNQASGDSATVFGRGNISSGFISTAFGRSNHAVSFAETTIGVMATLYTPMDANGFNALDRIFTIGNGEFSRSNALTIYKSGLMNINDEYNMPLTDGTAGQVMTTDGSGNISFVSPATITDTDNQTIDNLSLDGTTLRLSLEDDGQPLQTVNLASLQDGTGTDNQQIDALNLNGTTLEISLEDDGQPLQTLNLSALQDGVGGNLDQAYDFGGPGSGRTIIANNGKVSISGQDGFIVSGAGYGATGTALPNFGQGARMFFDPSTAAFRAGEIRGNFGLFNTNVWHQNNLGEFSLAMGLNPLASGQSSIALGHLVNATGISSVAIGRTNNASGNSAIALGESTTASGNNATAFGFHSEASGISSTAFGVFSEASATYAIAGGFRVDALSFSEITLGMFSTSYTPNSTTGFNNADRIFSIGNGISDGSRSNALTIYKSGLININDEYNMPLTDGSSGQVMTTDGTGNITFQNITGDGTGTDNQQIDALNLNGTTLEISLEDDGQPLQTVNLATLQDGTGTDNQNIQGLAFNTGTNMLTVGIENGTSQNINLSALDTGGDIMQVNAGNGLTGGGATGNVTINAVGINGITTNANDFRLGGSLTQNTIINQETRSFDINLNSTGDFAIQDNGTDVFFVEDSGEIGLGTSTPIYPVHMVETGPYNRGFYMIKTETSSSETAGIYVEKTGLGTGRSHAIFTETEGSGTGQKYGMFNRLTSTAAGNQYGVRNFLNGNTSAFQFGTFNNLANAATGNQYGTYNGMRGTAAANKYGTYNEFQEPITSATEIVGVRNRFTNGTPGTGGMSGIWTDFATPANGTYYGSRNEFGAAATGTGNKYGTYNSFSTSAGGTHFGSYNVVNVTNGWASYDLGKSYISQRLSIGETDNPDGRISILNNSGGANPAHIQLTETSANDGPRIQFANAAETNNEWTLFGRADNTLSDSQFNIFHTGTGNILRVEGDGNIGVTGNPDTDFHVFHGNNGNVSGMKLQNTNDNTWWRMYVSSGSDDLRLFNSNNGTTVMGAFNDATGAYTATSDRRLKKDFKELYFSWDNFMTMKPLTYKYKEDNKPTTYIGMVAQDVEKVYPELVTYHKDNDIYHMDYSATGIVAIKGVQELKKEVEILKSENEQLKAKLSKLESLEARLSALENNSDTNISETMAQNKK